MEKSSSLTNLDEKRNFEAAYEIEESLEPLSSRSKNIQFMDVWPQIVIGLASLTTAIQAGVGLAFSATLIPQLKLDPAISNFTSEQASWIASLPAVTTPIGALLSGIIMEMTGRKFCLLLSTASSIGTWIITYFTYDSLLPIYISRLLIGLAGGLATSSLVYCSEVCCSWSRGPVLCFNSVAVALGITMSTGLGLISWRIGALVLLALGSASFIVCSVLPESPVWLISHGNPTKAKSIIRRINLPDWLAEEEWASMMDSVARRREKVSKWFCLGQCEEPWARPLIILIGLISLQQFSGVYVVVSYAGSIFQSMGDLVGEENSGKGLINEWTATLALGVARLVFSIVSVALSFYFPRRPLLSLSSLGTCLSLLTFALLLNLGGWEPSPPSGLPLSSSPTLPILPPHLRLPAAFSLIASVSSASIGLMVFPWIALPEILPSSVRGPASGFIVSLAYVLMFLILKAFPQLLLLFSLSTILLVASLFAFLVIPYTYLFLPETFRKSYDEIQKSMYKSN